MGSALKYIGEGKAFGQVPMRDLSAHEAEAFAREYGGVGELIASGLYEKAESKTAKPTAKQDDEVN